MIVTLAIATPAKALDAACIGASNTAHSSSSPYPAYVTEAQSYCKLIGDEFGYDSMTNYAQSGASFDDVTPSGYPTIDGISTQLGDAIAGGADIVYVACCGNDFFKTTTSEETMISEFRADIASLISTANTAGVQLVFLSEPYAVDWWFNQRLRAGNAALKDMAEDNDIPFIDVFSKMENEATVSKANIQTWFRTYSSCTGTVYDSHMSATGHANFADFVINSQFAQTVAAPPPPPSGDYTYWADQVNITKTNNSLTIQQTSGTSGGTARAAHGQSSGKYYFEVTTTVAQPTYYAMLAGVTTGSVNKIDGLANAGSDDWVYDSNGRLNTNGAPAESTSVTAWENQGVTIGVALDIDNGTLDFIDKNGSTVTGFSSLPAGTYYPVAGFMAGANANNVLTANFGDSAWVHTPPSGFVGWDAP